MIVSKRILLMYMITVHTFNLCSAQLKIDDGLAGLFEKNDTVKQDFSSTVKNASNDVATIASVGFLFYKSFISSQDNPSCVFTPSCSEYAVQSIQKSGFFLGWLSTFDRLSRCHGLVNPHHYPFDIEHNRYYDPVQ